MYKIEITNEKGVFTAKLLFKFSFDREPTIKDVKRHADQSILYNEIKSWFKIQRESELKYN